MRSWRKHLVIVIAYIVAALVMSYPLALNFTSAIPGVEGDATSFVWALGWAKTALVDLHVNPFQSDFVFYPLGGATQLLWAISLLAALSIPLQFLSGLTATYNVLYLAATALTAYGMFLLAGDLLANGKWGVANQKFDASPLPPFQTFVVVRFVLDARRLTPRYSSLATFTAGLVFAFAPLRLGYGLSFFNLFNTQFIPFYVLFLIRARRRRSHLNAIIAGVLLGLNAYIDFQIAAFLVLFTVLYVLYWVVETIAANAPNRLAPTNPSPHTGRLGVLVEPVSIAVMVAVISLLVATPLLAIVGSDFAVEGGSYLGVFPIKYSADRSYDLLSFFVPNARSSLYASVPLKMAGINAGLNPDDVGALAPDRQSFIGYVVCVLAAYAVLRQWRQARFWFLAAALFALLSLGPSLHVLGRDTGIPLPYLLLHEVPILNHIRIPMRYGIVVSFALAILVAQGIDDLQKRIANRGSRAPSRLWHASTVTYGAGATNCPLSLALLLLPITIVLESAVLPYPIQSLPIPHIYADIARVPGDFTVLEIPTFHWRGAAATEVYQAIHGKRILRAYTNRIAPGLAEYFGTRGIPIVMRSLRILEGAEKGELSPEEVAEDKRVRDQVVQFFDLRYVILHRSYLEPDQVSAIDAYLRSVLAARSIYDDGETFGYEIPRTPQTLDRVEIDLCENIGQMYVGRGWQFEYPQPRWEDEFNFVWTRGAQSEIYFVADRGADRVMILHTYAESPRRVAVVLNSEYVGELTLVSEWKDYRVALPARAVRSGMNRVQLQYGAELREAVGVTTITIE